MRSVDPKAVAPDVAVALEPAFDFASPEYRAFFDLSRGTVFQAPLWLDSIHRTLGPALGARQHTITLRNRYDRSLVAVIPLMVRRSTGIAIIQPADFGVCDYNAVVGPREALESLAVDASVVARIDCLLTGGVLMFRKVRDDGFDASRLFRKAVASPCENAAYHIETGPDFEVWQRKTISRKFSKELGRLARQIERDHGRYEHRVATEEADIREAFAFLRAIRAGRFEGDLLDDPLFADFYLDFAIAGARSGEAITYVSTLDGKPVAALLGVAFADECHAVLIGADMQRFGKYSPGMQLLYRIIKLRFEQGLKRFDIGLGNTGYKSHLSAEVTTLKNFTSARSLPGAALAFVYHHAKPLKTAMRKLSPRLR
jgi:CelD/BcsL family acetyltransferase involved in cellulose biosynthesis